MKLFSSSSKKKSGGKKRRLEQNPAAPTNEKSSGPRSHEGTVTGQVETRSEKELRTTPRVIEEEVSHKSDSEGEGSESFEDLGLCAWVCKACDNMGFKEPTPIQKSCIPAVLKGKDVLGCAETGSGKTAAFALPMLQQLSQDPYGVFGLVLTPTRELALQIHEQFLALGAPLGLRAALVIGGVSRLEQSLELGRRPHVVVGTPGRVRAHLQGPSPPAVGSLRVLVLDEADRLLSEGFEGDLGHILERLPPSGRRQTLLLSATLTDALERLQSLAMTAPVLYNLTRKAAVPAGLDQRYLFMPQQMKLPYLFEALRRLTRREVWAAGAAEGGGGDDSDEEGGGGGRGARGRKKPAAKSRAEEEEEAARQAGLARSAVIFAGTCKRCQEVCEILNELGATCVALHSATTQNRRLAALGKFKSQQVRILVSTDVGSRGLDIPEVDLVVNLDLPRQAVDYVHRVGRTARAGRAGRAVSLVAQYEVGLVHQIEEYTGVKLALCGEVEEEAVLGLLNAAARATRVARLRLIEQGFDEKVEGLLERKKKSRQQRRTKKG